MYKVKGRRFAASLLNAGLGHVHFEKRTKPQPELKAVKLKIPLHKITAKFYNNKTFRQRKTKS